jgi:hypothetical protein
MFMKFKVITCLIGLMHLTVSGASGAELHGAGGSNGGAGVKRDGKYMSFYSAGLYVEPVDQWQPPYSPPQLDRFMKFVREFRYWSKEDKARLLETAIPSNEHQYFKVKEDQFDTVVRERLLDEFHRVTGQPLSGLELFALTDIEKRRTFLLPGFYQLKPSDQVAILFHENFWILKGKGTDYRSVVEAELAFQAVYEQPDNGHRIMDLISRFGDGSGLLEAAAKVDLDSGALKDVLVDGGLPLGPVFGDSFAGCGSDCVRGVLAASLLEAMQRHPNSVILRRLWGSQRQRAIKLELEFTRFSMRLSTPMGWVLFPNRESVRYAPNLEDFLLRLESAEFPRINFSSCTMSLQPGLIGTLKCSDTDSSVKEGSLRLQF